MSILIPMVRGFLLVNRGYDHLPRNFLIRDAGKIANKIRDAFGRFDETDEECCASRIRVLMEKAASEGKTVL